jgi:hypothetical protein
VLLRDAMTTRAEIAREPDPIKRREMERARDVATVEVSRITRDKKTFAQLSREHQLEVRWLVDALARQQRRLPLKERKHFPTRRDGRPRDDHRRLLIAVTMRELTRDGMTVAAAIAHVAGPSAMSRRRAKEIYYSHDLDVGERSEWERLIRVELARRAAERICDEARAIAAALSLPA